MDQFTRQELMQLLSATRAKVALHTDLSAVELREEVNAAVRRYQEKGQLMRSEVSKTLKFVESFLKDGTQTPEDNC